MLDHDYQFAGKEADEEVVLVIKPHWWYFIKSLIYILVVALVLMVLLYFFGASTVTSWAFFISLTLSLYFLATAFYKWSNTTYLLTNERIIIVEQLGWFNRVMSEATLENILFISHKTQGLVSTLFNFGTIHIRTSGVVEEEIVLNQVSDPYEVQQQIVGAQKKYTGKIPESKNENENKEFWQAQEKKKIIR